MQHLVADTYAGAKMMHLRAAFDILISRSGRTNLGGITAERAADF